MGQGQSGTEKVLTDIPDDLQRQATAFREMAILSYEEFLKEIKELNKISHSFVDTNGKRLVFAVKKGSDSSLLWKATVKIGCVKVDAETNKIESYRLLNLKQFLQVYKLIIQQSHMGLDEQGNKGGSHSADTLLDHIPTDPRVDVAANDPFTTSSILNKVDDLEEAANSLDECCICMERRPEVILPCAHSYCLPCIEQWNVSNKTCPVCREELDSTDESWVISEAPNSTEMAAEIQKYLIGLADKQ